MCFSIGIIGGDKRNLELMKIYENQGNKVNIIGFDKTDNEDEFRNIIKRESVAEVIKDSNVIITPIPISKDNKTIYTPYSNKVIYLEDMINCLENVKDKIIILGNINNENLNKKNRIIDILKEEEYLSLNSIATVEGTISLIIENTEINLQSQKVLVLGCGRIGKMLLFKIKQLAKDIMCISRNLEELNWCKLYGYKYKKLENIERIINEYDIIINTIPSNIIKEEDIEQMKKRTLFIELASLPGGVEQKKLEEKNIKYLRAMGLPGKYSPKETANIIKDILDKKI